MKNRVITILSNDNYQSNQASKLLTAKLEKANFTVSTSYTKDTELVVCIGGDGAFLRAVHECEFPSIPFVGINTGHLGFFQEFTPFQLDDFIFMYTNDKYSMQNLSTIRAEITCENGTFTHFGINEIIVKGKPTYSVHLDISLGNNFIERFSGDGILVATPSGSTAYNYSLGGSIVDPRLKIMQVTPIAPMNTTAYRSFTSSILLPSDMWLGIIPEKNGQGEKSISILSDGYEFVYEKVKDIKIEYSEKTVNLMRFEGYDFWRKVKSKFL